MSNYSTILDDVNEFLEDWRVLLTGGIMLVMVAVAMQFKNIKEGFVHLPWWVYLVLGVASLGAGVWKFEQEMEREIE